MNLRTKENYYDEGKKDETWAQPIKYMEEMLEIANKLNAKFVILLWPNTQPNLFHKFAESNKIPIIDLTPYWQRERMKYKLPNNPHPNPKGHKLTANLLFDKLLELNKESSDES